MTPIFVAKDYARHTEVLSTDHIIVKSRKDNGFGIVAVYTDDPKAYKVYLKCGRWDVMPPYKTISELIEKNIDRFEFFIV